MNFPTYPKYKDSGVEWISKIPEDWDIIRLKYILKLKNGMSPEFDDKGIYDIIGSNGKIGKSNKYNIDHQHLIIGRVGACGSVNIAPGKSFISDNAFIVDLNPKINFLYIFYILKAMRLENLANKNAQPLINSTQIRNERISYPSIIEQNEISSFLDKKTSEIDNIIEKYAKMIELLKEKRIVLINQVVTKGLNSVKLKDSEVEWLGEIPEYWDIFKAKHLFNEINERSKFGDEELLSVSHITGVTPRSEKPNVYMFKAESNEGYKICKDGDLVINTMWAWMGALGFAKQEGIVSPSYNVYRFRTNGLVQDYYDALFRTPPFTAEITRWSKGIWTSRLRLYPKEFFRIELPVPPENEQIEIAKLIQKENKKTDEMIKPIKKAISLLEEYKISLISQAVTGKIDLRNNLIGEDKIKQEAD